MAVIEIYACPASFKYGCMSVDLSALIKAPRILIEARKVDEVVESMQSLLRVWADREPAQGRYVGARKVSGRAPAGFGGIKNIRYVPAADAA